MRLRHKQIITSDTRYRKKGDALKHSKSSTDFNMDIDLPVGGADPDVAGTNITVTGPVSPTIGLTCPAWYSDSIGNNTTLGLATIGASTTGTGNWSVTFNAPAAGDYMFNIQGTYTPARQTGTTTILISAAFTTA